MFELKKPCSACPFKRGNGSNFQLHQDRLTAIFAGPAFQCHKTIDYDRFEDPHLRQGNKPQQCAGLMGLLVQEDRPNQIMQVAERLKAFEPDALHLGQCYRSFAEAREAHKGREPDDRKNKRTLGAGTR